MKIDVVILWVNGNDSKWIDNYNKYCPENLRLDNDKQRYRDWDTLKYVFRGIERNMPWVNKIHFVTCGQRPDWMNVSHPKLRFVSHEDIFLNNDFLPTFNSSAIELNLSRIPGLSEKFIYFNDDMLVLENTSVERFFKNDKPVDFLVEAIPRRGYIYERFRSNSSWVYMVNNSVDLINNHYSKTHLIKNDSELYFNKAYGIKSNLINYFFSKFKNYIAFEHYHHPQPYVKKQLQTIEENCKIEFENTFKSKFRNKTNLSQTIFRYSQLASGNFFPSKFDDHLCINVRDEKTSALCISAIQNKRFVCINDEIDSGVDNELIESIINKIILELDVKLPNKSSYEL